MYIHVHPFFLRFSKAIRTNLLYQLMSVLRGGSETLLGRGAFIPNQARRVTWPDGSLLVRICEVTTDSGSTEWSLVQGR